MKVLYGLELLDRPLEGSALTVGNFDGVHVGHQEILRRAGELAADCRLPAVAMTFDPHPLAIVAPAKAPLRLMSVDERVQRLAKAGANIVVVARSEISLLSMEAERFIEDVLLARFRPQHIVEGATFGFGKGRKGNAQILREIAGKSDCKVHIVEPVSVKDARGKLLQVSSSAIRALLGQGDVASAAICLGRPYAIESNVIRGAGRGRGIGFPTANIVTPQGQVEPAEGVYAGRTWVGNFERPCAISIGRAQTFGGGPRQVETHILDFSGDLYDQLIRMEFLVRIRDQRAFANAEELTRQIKDDVEFVRREFHAAIKIASG